MAEPGAPPEPWPALPLASWQATRDTVHQWTQVVGKTRLALAPMQNHWWNVPLYVNGVGLTTSLMPLGSRGSLEVVFDFISHELVLRLTDGRRRHLKLASGTVAGFHAEFLAALTELGVEVTLNPMPAEIPGAVPFPENTGPAAYDPAAMNAFWQSLVSSHRVMSRFRGEFRGKCSPVHFFWGAFDLAVTRFSGRAAPPHPGGVPHCPDWVMVEAYNEEVSSCGYWPGGADEGVFYAYAYPEPPGYRHHRPGPAGAHFDTTLGEYVLPYDLVRQSVDPERMLLDFLRTTHRLAEDAWRSSP